ncbi:hypothetical protein [Nonomuraea sp. NPDC049695]|uniref:hypothetical protein n=1 Tax=Nonomuraea sp. NPDC049695 TaxID=3154734 RepID=UPI003429F96C
MPAHEEMAALYGRANNDSSPFFTTEVLRGPEFLTVIDVTTAKGVDHREVIIGGRRVHRIPQRRCV